MIELQTCAFIETWCGRKQYGKIEKLEDEPLIFIKTASHSLD
jgi:hypothetical protein